MTYREKLQIEHPEYIGTIHYGGCAGCPSTYGYAKRGTDLCDTEDACASEATCRKCWDRVIPGTEDKQYENWTRDELMRLIRNYEVRDDAHEKKHEDDRKEIELLKEESEIKFQAKDNIIDALEKRNEELEQKIAKLVGACSAKNAEIAHLQKELEEERTRKYFWCEDNCCAMVKDKEIQRLKDDLKECQMKLAVYRSQAMQTYGTCCCHPDILKDGEILLYRDRVVVKNDTFIKLNADIIRLSDELKKEKKEHAKHHGLFGRFYHD